MRGFLIAIRYFDPQVILWGVCVDEYTNTEEGFVPWPSCVTSPRQDYFDDIHISVPTAKLVYGEWSHQGLSEVLLVAPTRTRIYTVWTIKSRPLWIVYGIKNENEIEIHRGTKPSALYVVPDAKKIERVAKADKDTGR